MTTPELTVTAVYPGDAVLPQIERLYLAAFPAVERVPFARLVQRPLAGYDDGLWAFWQAEAFCGFMTTITRGDLTLIGYFAMVPELRGQGLGSAALRLLRARLPKQRITLEIEVLDPTAANYAQRLRRRDFYARNGYRLTPITYRTYGVPFVVMVNGAAVSAAEYHRFYDPLIR